VLIAASNTKVSFSPCQSISRVSLTGDDFATDPSAAYLHGTPPSAIWVPTPVAVKNADIPAPGLMHDMAIAVRSPEDG